MKKLLALAAIVTVSTTTLAGCKKKNEEWKTINENETIVTEKVREAFEDLIDGTAFEEVFSSDDLSKLTLGQATRAVFYAGINTQDMIDAPGIGGGAGTLSVGHLTPNVIGATDFTPSLNDKGKAGKLLEAIKSEYPKATWDYNIYFNPGTRKNIAEVAQTSLKDIGLNITLIEEEWSTHLANTLGGKHDLYVGGWTAVTGHADYGLYGVFHSGGVGSGNRTFFKKDEVDRLLDSAKWDADAYGEGGDSEKAQKIIAREFPSLPLYDSQVRFALDPEFQEKGLEMNPALHHYFGTINNPAEFTVGSIGAFRNLHPHGSNDSASTAQNAQVFESLWDTDGTNITGKLISGEPVTNTENGTVTFTVDDSKKFSDGTFLTGEAVKNSINWAADAVDISSATAGILGATHSGNEVTIQFGTKIDGQTLDLTNPSTFDGKLAAAWRQLVAHPALAIVSKDISDYDGDNIKDTNALGTGPYKFESISVSTQNVEMIKNDHYSGLKAHENRPTKIKFEVFADWNGLIASLKDGNVKFADAVPASYFTDEHMGVGKAGTPYASYSNSHIGFNTGYLPPTSN